MPVISLPMPCFVYLTNSPQPKDIQFIIIYDQKKRLVFFA